MTKYTEGEPVEIADDEILEIDPVRDQVEQVLSPDEMEAKKKKYFCKTMAGSSAYGGCSRAEKRMDRWDIHIQWYG